MLKSGFSWIFYFKALQLGKVSQVAPIDKTSIAIIFSFIFLGEPISAKILIGASLIIFGTIILII